LLERVGVLGAINRAGFVRSTGHTVKWAGSDVRVERFPNGAYGWQVSRDALDRVLLRTAQQAGARVSRGASVRRIVRDGNTWQVAYEFRGRLRYLSASRVIDCTGRSGLMSRRDAGRVSTSPQTMALVGMFERRPHWHLDDASHTYVESYAGGWAWSVPVSRTRRQVTVMLDPSHTRVSKGQRLLATYRRELARTTLIRAIADQGRLVSAPWAREASTYTCESPVRDGVLLAGDAASFVDPLSSFGVKKAIASAWLAAVATHTALTDADLEADAQRLFCERERAMVDGLGQQLRGLATDAAGVHASEFWSDRAHWQDRVSTIEPDVDALRYDEGVRAAFETIRASESLSLRRAVDVRRVWRPVVVDHLVQRREHLCVPAFPDGLRYLRNVDALHLLDLAPRYGQVPELYDAYQRTAPPVPLEDFLGVLAVLIAKGVLRIA
jgi:2-polyprenyl-6-methoxyphenol hydroxylase-like FAD-dependent oxidoreductase